MFIQTETTPNPATIKFLPGQQVMPSGTREFSSEEEAKASPLAERLFKLGPVKSVFFGTDFISVTKTEEGDWQFLKARVLAAVMEHFSMGFALFHEDAAGQASQAHEGDDEITRQIKILLDERVRPAVAQDGGDVLFDRFEQGIVYLHMRGACSGCPSAAMTLKSGIETMLRHYVPEVLEVRQAGL